MVEKESKNVSQKQKPDLLPLADKHVRDNVNNDLANQTMSLPARLVKVENPSRRRPIKTNLPTNFADEEPGLGKKPITNKTVLRDYPHLLKLQGRYTVFFTVNWERIFYALLLITHVYFRRHH